MEDGLDLFLDRPGIKDGGSFFVKLYGRNQICRDVFQLADDALVKVFIVDYQTVHMFVEKITDEVVCQSVFFKDAEGSLGELKLFFDQTPGLGQSLVFVADIVFIRTFGFGTHNESVGGVFHFSEDTLDAAAFVLGINLAGNGDLILIGEEYQVFARDGDLSGEAGTFGADGALVHLHHYFLAGFEQFADLGAIGRIHPFAGFVVFIDLQKVQHDIAIMQEGSALQPYFYKGCAHAGKYVFHYTLVDIPHRILVIFALYKKLDQPVILQDGHPLFQGVYVDDDFCIYTGFAHINLPLSA